MKKIAHLFSDVPWNPPPLQGSEVRPRCAGTAVLQGLRFFYPLWPPMQDFFPLCAGLATLRLEPIRKAWGGRLAARARLRLTLNEPDSGVQVGKKNNTLPPWYGWGILGSDSADVALEPHEHWWSQG